MKKSNIGWKSYWNETVVPELYVEDFVEKSITPQVNWRNMIKTAE
jgi:spore cortex formation protein SpoVR/YcgB (stage V sporulation)